MIILHDPATLLHNTVELLGAKTRPALESPARIEIIVKNVRASSHDLHVISFTLGNPQKVKDLLDVVRDTHGQDYLDHLKQCFGDWTAAGLIEQTESILPECFIIPTKVRAIPQPPKDIFARAGYFAFDMSSGIMEKTYLSTLASANLACEAVEMLRNQRVEAVLALCRPPGHHCDGNRAGGYCYINNAAAAISTWRKQSPHARVGILDVDFHHGNGTQEIYYSDPNVFYSSIHGEGEFPYYTGFADELGAEPAVGTNLNLPLAPGSTFEQYLEKLDMALNALSKFQSEFLVVSLGFDTFHLDPLGNFEIDTENYHTLAGRIGSRLGNVPAVILLEGGYVLEHLGANVLSFLSGWEGRKP